MSTTTNHSAFSHHLTNGHQFWGYLVLYFIPFPIQRLYGYVYAGGPPRLPPSSASSILCMVPFCNNAHTLPLALGFGFVAQKNITFAVLLGVRSVSPWPVARGGLSRNEKETNARDALFTWWTCRLDRRDADPLERERRLYRSREAEQPVLRGNEDLLF